MPEEGIRITVAFSLTSTASDLVATSRSTSDTTPPLRLVTNTFQAKTFSGWRRHPVVIMPLDYGELAFG
jgi:hypothetical protein